MRAVVHTLMGAALSSLTFLSLDSGLLCKGSASMEPFTRPASLAPKDEYNKASKKTSVCPGSSNVRAARLEARQVKLHKRCEDAALVGPFFLQPSLAGFQARSKTNAEALS